MTADGTTTLHNGRQVATDSEEWKLECLAHHVLSLPFEQRKPWIADVRMRAGEAAGDALAARVTAIHRASKAALA